MNLLKHFLLLSAAVLGLFLTSVARPVDLETAKTIASKFMGTNDLRLSFTYTTDENMTVLYVFNTTDGFVIVAADDCETPIIGYSHEGHFNPNNVPVQMEEYLQDFVAKIQYGIENHIEADAITARQWELVKTTGKLNDYKTTQAVAPLLTEMWHQGCLYNSLCPTMEHTPCGHAEAGCAAVAMGQIMHYWKYPATGWGSHSYANAGVTLSADFGNTVYDWDHMPDSLTESSSDTEIEAVATILYHCGVSVNMSYTSTGSGADANDVPNALIRYFNYSKRLHLEKRNDYNDDEWLLMLKNCLDLQQPVFYTGHGNQGGHAFVCDGYDNNDLIHLNWGWGVANGYFSLGNLNPLTYTFNKSQSAIFDIYPHYDPCLVFATANPPTAGTIEGSGEYHIGERCTLTVTPAENYEFYCWKNNGQITTYNTTYSFEVLGDTDFVAYFSLQPAKQIEASYVPDTINPNFSCVNLSWNTDDTEWILLKQFDSNEDCGVATDGESIYTCRITSYQTPFGFGKYTMDGDLVEHFDVRNNFEAANLAYDGSHFYCNNIKAWQEDMYRLYCVDLDNKRIIDSIDTGIEFNRCAYDPENDGFWLTKIISGKSELTLVDRQGQRIAKSPKIPGFIRGLGHIIAKDESPHLLVLMEGGAVYDYDITCNSFKDRPVLVIDDGYAYGTFIGEYDGKDAMFAVVGTAIRIYEIRNTLSQVIGYRLYRADREGHTDVLADEVTSTSYIDPTWGNAVAGMYRFGISSIFANGTESEIIWSDFIEKTDYGIDENGQETPEQTVQKVFENGQIVIIKDGKRYNVSGKQLN